MKAMAIVAEADPAREASPAAAADQAGLAPVKKWVAAPRIFHP